MHHRAPKSVLILWLMSVATLTVAAAAQVAFAVEAMPQRGFYDAPVEVRLAAEQAGWQIRFTTDGREPSPEAGEVYSAPLRLAGQTVLRAAAFEDGRRISPIVTHTYVFLDDVLRQPKAPPGLPSGTRAWNGHPSAYEMDPRVVNDPAYAPRMKDALRALPTLSIVCPPSDLFGARRGLYLNTLERGEAWERACSVEWIPADAGPGFQVDCGVQIQGNYNRIPEKTPKHSFRLLFKERYGPGKLRFPVFPDSPVASFNTLILRAGYNNTWTHWEPVQHSRADPNRDGWMKDTFRAMGWLTTHDRFVHLYLNGLYWGLYNVSERPDGAFASSYMGGKREDYDVINESEVKGGTGEAFARLERARGLANPERYAAVAAQLDLPRFIDYLLLNYYAGNSDWGQRKNWYALRRREPAGPFQFFIWDAEHTFENLHDNAVERPREPPLQIARELMASAEFRMAFADRVQKHCFDGGLLTPESAAARWMTRARQISLPIIAESARWGYYWRRTPFTRNGDWIAEQRSLMEGYFPQRTGILLQQLRAAGLFPDVAAPALQKQDGADTGAARIAFAPPERGEIYYTTDGSDPRQPGGAVSRHAARYAEPITLRGPDVLKARVRRGQVWSALTEFSLR